MLFELCLFLQVFLKFSKREKYSRDFVRTNFGFLCINNAVIGTLNAIYQSVIDILNL